jgi:tRNA threonylcarbamoyladenosine biosynthesis protein TsaB
MSCILCIETATDICSVALLKGDKMVALQENHEGNAHASQITLLIEAVMKDANMELKQLDAISVSKGPGSYTGLRVGVSTAKGLCYALDIPLIGINTLESLSHETIKKVNGKSQNANFCAMLDARRMEVYCAVYDEKMNLVKKTEAKIIGENSFADLLETSTVYFFGNGSAKCKSMIKHKNAIFIDDIKCSASNMNHIAQKLFHEKQFEDVAYFEPFYLKDFVGTVPAKK